MPERRPELLRIVKTNWLGRLGARFGLRTARPGPALLDPVVQAVTNVDDLLLQARIVAATINIGSGEATAHTVPDGKRWRVLRLFRDATVGSTRMWVDNGVTHLFVLAAGTAETVAQVDIPMDQKWTLGLLQANVADTAIDVKLLVVEEDAY